MTLKDESDYDLIEWIELQDDYPEEGKEALAIVYERYKRKLYKVLFSILRKHGINEEEVVDLVTDTFYKIYSKKLSCERKEGASENSFLYWLVAIAKNIYYSSLNDQRKENEHFQLSYSSFEEDQEDEELISEITEDLYPNEELVVDYIQSLPDREREILLAYYDSYEKGKYTPSKVMPELALRYNTSVDYIRNIRNRQKKALISKLSSKIKMRK